MAKLFGIGAIVFLMAALVVAFSVSDRPIVRYQDYPCQYQAIFLRDKALQHETTREVVIFSNSRGMVGLDANQLADSLSRRSGLPTHVIDLGKSWRGNELNLQLAEDYFRNHSADLVLIEFNQAKSPRARYHENSFYTLTVGRLAKLILTDEREPVWQRPGRLFYALSMRLLRPVEDQLVGRFKDLSALDPLPKVTSVDCPHSPRLVNVRSLLVREKYNERNDWQRFMLNFDFDHASQKNHMQDMLNMIDLARRNGADVALFYVHEYFDRRMHEDMLETIELRAGVPLIKLDDRQLSSWYAAHVYHDPTHFTREGTKRFVGYLTANLPSTLKIFQGN